MDTEFFVLFHGTSLLHITLRVQARDVTIPVPNLAPVLIRTLGLIATNAMLLLSNRDSTQGQHYCHIPIRIHSSRR